MSLHLTEYVPCESTGPQDLEGTVQPSFTDTEREGCTSVAMELPMHRAPDTVTTVSALRSRRPRCTLEPPLTTEGPSACEQIDDLALVLRHEHSSLPWSCSRTARAWRA